MLGIKSYRVDATEPIPAGTTQVRMESPTTAAEEAKGGDVTLYYDSKEVGKGRVDQTQGFIFSPLICKSTTRFGRLSWSDRQCHV